MTASQEADKSEKSEKPLHSRDVYVAAAQTAVAASMKTGRPVDPRVKKLAESG